MNGYQELREIHALSQEAIVIFDSGEFPSRTLIARIREIAGVFPKYGSDDEYIGFARWRHRGDNQDAYLVLCDSDDEGAFKVYRRAKAGASRPVEAQTPIKAVRGKCALSDDLWWCGNCGRGIGAISTYASPDFKAGSWAFCPKCGNPINWSDAPVPAPPADTVIHKTACCFMCHCSQTLPESLQQCGCSCHWGERKTAPPADPPKLAREVATKYEGMAAHGKQQTHTVFEVLEACKALAAHFAEQDKGKTV